MKRLKDGSMTGGRNETSIKSQFVLQIPFQFLFIARNFTRYFIWQSGVPKRTKLTKKCLTFFSNWNQFRGHLRPSEEATWGYLRPCEAIEVIWDHVRSFQAMWGHFRPLRSFGYQRGQNYPQNVSFPKFQFEINFWCACAWKWHFLKGLLVG